MSKNFTAIASGIYNNQLVYLTTSDCRSVFNPDGLTPIETLDFLFSLKRSHKKEVFVYYAFSRENEFVFSLLPSAIKDKLFQSFRIRKEIGLLENENEKLEEIIFLNLDAKAKEQAQFEYDVNRLALDGLKEIKYKDYEIELVNGKQLRLKKNKTCVTFFDVFGFFRKSLFQSVKTWLDETVISLNKDNINDLNAFNDDTFLHLKSLAYLEAEYIKKLTIKLNTELEKCGINLSSYHGATAVSSWFLSKTKAKKQYYSYKQDRKLGYELSRAVNQSIYAGRAEQFKLGYFENVNVYDINSAYAYACTFLPVLLGKPAGITKYKPIPFSCWHLDFDFNYIADRLNDFERLRVLYFGYLPFREIGGNLIRYKLRGRGYFWHPEVKFLLEHYPECVKVNHGFAVNAETAPFTKGISLLYELRLLLKQQQNPLEKVLKLALASLYGKFCQRQGSAYYYNLFYAGFITSFVRAMLLRATLGKELNTICFLTDAIHTTADLSDNIDLSDKLGSFRLQQYSNGIYLDNGVYQLTGIDGKRKIAHRGFNKFDFEKAIKELRECKGFTEIQEFFVGHNLHSLMPVEFSNYLDLQSVQKKTNPTDSALRLFDRLEVDLSSGFIDSKPVRIYSGAESAVYKPKHYKESDCLTDFLIANK